MSDTPWLSIIGLGEDGPEGLSAASRKALLDAEIIMGPPRHLQLLGSTDASLFEWPVPFVDGIEKLIQAGVRAVVQPSGSIRDKEIINFANETDTVLLFSKTRHFRH